MIRDRINGLRQWQADSLRKPLIIRGCRQVGKSYLVREFAREFDTFIEINFEKEKSAHQYFQGDLNIDQLLEKLSIYKNKAIRPGKTLIFFDEVQMCEEAITTLRYFKEDKPEIHIIAAGSLLDFALNKIGIPVGRVQFMHLYPLSFGEYLTNLNLGHLREFIGEQKKDAVIHQQLLDHLKNYMWLGGMPAVLNVWLDSKDPIACQRTQDEIIEAYQIDFHKYAKDREIPHITKVFEKIPAMLGRKFIYSHIDSDIRVEHIKNALLLLEQAGITKRCFHTSAQKPPLAAEQDEKKFKAFYFDIGIAQRILGLDIKHWMLNPIPISNQGGIAEQLIAQELLAYSDFHKTPKLHYWHREEKSSNAEVDFVIDFNGEIVPVEVKSSTKGSMRSMQVFLDSHKNSKFGLKISELDFGHVGQIVEIPLYATEGWLKNAKPTTPPPIENPD